MNRIMFDNLFGTRGWKIPWMQNKSAGKLFFCKGDDLNGYTEPEIDALVGDNYPAGTEQIFIGGHKVKSMRWQFIIAC